MWHTCVLIHSTYLASFTVMVLSGKSDLEVCKNEIEEPIFRTSSSNFMFQNLE